MARTMMEVALAPEDLDALFEKQTDRQYTRSLPFSTMVDLMGIVVSKSQPSIHAAFQEVKETLPVSLTAVYDKLNGLELAVTSAMVRHSADKLAPIIVAMRGTTTVTAAWLSSENYRRQPSGVKRAATQSAQAKQSRFVARAFIGCS